VSQDTLRLRKTPPADSMEAAEVVLSDIVKQALEKEMNAEPDRLMSMPTGPLFVAEDSGLKDLDGNQIVPQELLNDLPIAPISWNKGQLLNVRNRGEFYVVTLLGEEDDPPLKPAPNGALRFTNTALCQDFVSKWYATEHHDPRAR
jgi:hypothetical protein